MFKVYQPSVAIQPVSGPDAGAAADLLADKLDKFSKGAMATRGKLVSAKSAREGEEAGSKIGFKPLEENTEQDIIYNKAAMQMQKMVVNNRIRNSSMQFKQDAVDNLNPNSLNEYDERMKNFAAQTMSDVSKEMKPYAENMISYYGFSNRSPVATSVKGLNKNIASSNLQVSSNNNLSDAAKAAYSGDEPGAVGLRVQHKKSLDAALASGLISSSYYSSSLDAMDKTIRLSNYEGQFGRALNSGKGADSLANFNKTDQKDLTPDEKNFLTRRFDGMMTQHKQAVTAKFGNIDQKVKDMETGILLNGVNAATQGSMDKLTAVVRDAYQDKPEKAAQLVGDMQAAVHRHNFQESQRYAPPVQIQHNLNQAFESLKKDPTAANAKNYELLKQDTAAALKQRKDDPYSIAIKHPSVMNALKGERSADKGNVSLATGDKLGSATKGSIDDVDHSLISVQQQMGIPKSDIQIVPKSQLNQVASAITNAQPQDAVQMMNDVVDAHPNNRGLAMSNLQKVVKPANFMMLNIASTPETAKHANFAYTAMNQDAKSLESMFNTKDIARLKDKTRNEFMKDYGQSLLNVNGDPTKILDSGIDYCYKLAMVYKANGVDDPVGTAVNDAVMAHSQVGTYNGYKYVIPASKSYSPKLINQSVKAVVKGIDSKDLKVPDYYMPGVASQRDREVSYKQFLQSHTYPVTTNDNGGVRLLDDSRIPVKTKSGKDVGFGFQDIHLSTSFVNKQIVAQLAKGNILVQSAMLSAASLVGADK